MASIIRDNRRGTWSIQWWNGERWTRNVVLKKPRDWSEGKSLPEKPPNVVLAALGEYLTKEEEARERKGPSLDRPVADFLDDYLKGYRTIRKTDSVAEFEKARAVFLRWCESRKITLVKDVTKEACNQWIAERAATAAQRTGKPIAWATLQKEKGLLGGAWSHGLACGKVLENPWAKLVIPAKPIVKKRGSWSLEQYRCLLAKCRPWLHDLIVIGCHCGLRIKALKNIEWSDVQWNTDPETPGFGFLRVRPEFDKAGKGYSVPIHPDLHDVLARRLMSHQGEHQKIITGQSGRPIKSTASSAESIVLACERAGLPKPDSPNHHLRRTFGRWAVLGRLTGTPVPMYTVSRWLGHSTIAMTQRYLDIDDVDSTRFMLGDVGGRAG